MHPRITHPHEPNAPTSPLGTGKMEPASVCSTIRRTTTCLVKKYQLAVAAGCDYPKSRVQYWYSRLLQDALSELTISSCETICIGF